MLWKAGTKTGWGKNTNKTGWWNRTADNSCDKLNKLQTRTTGLGWHHVVSRKKLNWHQKIRH